MARCILQVQQGHGCRPEPIGYPHFTWRMITCIYKALIISIKGDRRINKQLQPGYGRTKILYHIVVLHPCIIASIYMDSDCW